MISFLPGGEWLAIAGLAAAAGPVVIHLLNRRIFRQVDWAAMEFLLEASRRSKAFLRLRDLLLMALRMAAVALFGLAVARPFLATGGAAATSGPVHAILVLDNSMSMGRERLGGATLLDDARTRAAEFIEQLPAGSRMSVVPLCGAPAGTTLDAYRTKEDALEAVAAVPVVDRMGTAAAAEALAARAAAAVPDLPEKRIVFLGDQQAINWAGRDREAGDAAKPQEPQPTPEIQVVSVTPPDRDNSWVESFRIEDGVADTESEATLTAVVRHAGAAPRAGVRVTLLVDGVEAAATAVDLEPGQAREVPFRHRFVTDVEPGRIASVAVEATLAHDHLPEDDSRSIVVPVTAALPVVFIDQYGADGEQPIRGRIGETRHLRTLLAPVARDQREAPLVKVRHVTMDGLSREVLEDARLAVIAGVAAPAPDQVALLRDYVAQGGRLMIAAGGDFEPAAWTQAAWLDGAGILPAPLDAAVGRMPDEGGDLRPFLLDVRTFQDNPLFRLAGVSLADLRDLYETPLFFKAVRTIVDETTLAAAAAATAQDATQRGERLTAIDAELARLATAEKQSPLPPRDAQRRTDLLDERAALAPDWLTWARDLPADDASQDERTARPTVVAAFDNGLPFLVARRLGRGEVVWAATGMFSNWNTLPKTNGMLILDRLLRGMLAATLPSRNFDTVAAITLPIATADRRADITVTAPDGTVEALGVESLGGDRFGVTLRDACRRGVYVITAADRPADGAARDGADGQRWRMPVAVNGPAEESQPAVLDAATFTAAVGGDPRYRWVGPAEPIGLAAAKVSGQQSWWWLLLAALACLLCETAILAWPYREPSGAGKPSTGATGVA
jgi:hypothetical protein